MVIRNGTPFLFRDADDSAAKLRAFLFNGESNVSETKNNVMDVCALCSFCFN